MNVLNIDLESYQQRGPRHYVHHIGKHRDIMYTNSKSTATLCTPSRKAPRHYVHHIEKHRDIMYTTRSIISISYIKSANPQILYIKSNSFDIAVAEDVSIELGTSDYPENVNAFC